MSGTLSIVAPCYNEAQGIEAFYRELKSALSSLMRYKHEIIFIDDGSTDATLAVLNPPGGR